MKRCVFGVGMAGAAAVIPVAGWRRFTGWQRNWGASLDEQLRTMPGDEFVGNPDFRTTRAITVHAPPEAIWPWLAQMGKGRGGLYSYDFLDRLFGYIDAPSSKVILPQFQDIQPGDLIPLGRGAPFPVAEAKKNEHLVLAGEQDETKWSWSTALYPQADGTTRLVTRNAGSGTANGFASRLLLFGIDLAAFIMVRRWLVVLKGRAEGLERAAERAEGLAEAV
jgi:hypothetical protein